MLTAGDPIPLQCENLRLVLHPALGGSIGGLWLGETPILRSNPHPQSVRETACYPLVPYSNRIAHGAFDFQGENYQIAKNFLPHPHSIHGIAWQKPWRVLPSDEHSKPAHTNVEVRLELVHQPTQEPETQTWDWPFAFSVQQHLHLTARGLRMEMHFRNDDHRPAPLGLGWHPYFTLRPDTRIRTQIEGRWLNDSAMLPSQWLRCASDTSPFISKDGELSGHPAAMALDHCFNGWNQTAHIHDSQFHLTLTSNMDYLVVFTPEYKDYFCLEPVTHRNNAIHHPQAQAVGLRTLAPQESCQVWMEIMVQTQA
jgi:aldose 1-epimerase